MLSAEHTLLGDAPLLRAALPGLWTPRALAAAAAPSAAPASPALALLQALLAPPARCLTVARHHAEGGGGGGGGGGARLPPLPPALLHPLYHAIRAVQLAWPVLLVGPPASGKSAVVQALAGLAGARLRHIAPTPSTDATEFPGCYEKVSVGRGGGAAG